VLEDRPVQLRILGKKHFERHTHFEGHDFMMSSA